jgi:hypothetical protein
MRDDFEALTIANIIARFGGDVFSVSCSEYGWFVWAKIHPASLALVDQEWSNTLEGGSAG